MSAQYNCDDLIAFLGMVEDDHVLQRFLQSLGPRAPIERVEHYGFLEYKDRGISVAFKEAQSIFTNPSGVDPRALHLAAFHLYGGSQAGYCEFEGGLPHDVQFGDSRELVTSKMGRRGIQGGGGRDRFLGLLPLWTRYDEHNVSIHFQFDGLNCLEQVTLSLPKKHVQSCKEDAAK